MTAKKSGGLGRGLSSILPDTKDFEMANTVTAAISTIPLDKIVSNPYQPRKEFGTGTVHTPAGRHHPRHGAQDA